MNLANKKYFLIIFVLLITYFGFSLFWIIKSDLTIMWNYRDIYNLATIYFEKGYLAAKNEPGIMTPGLVVENLNYLDQFTNNLGLLFFIIVIGKIFGHSVLTYEIMNLIIMCITFILICKLVEKQTRNRGLALLSLIGSMLFLPFLLYTPTFYNDVLVMPLILGSVYLLFDNNNKITKNKFKLVTAFILLSIGYIFRAPLIIIIIIIALIIVFILKKRILEILYLIMTFAIISFSFNLFVNSTGIYEDKNIIGTPIFHWIAMAQNEHTLGQNYIYDYIDTFQMLHDKTPKSEITQKKKELFVQRVKEKGVLGNLVFNAKKISYLWSDPLYEGWFTYVLEPNDKQVHKNMFSEGIGAVLVYSYAKIYQNILCLGILFISIKKVIKKNYGAFDLIVMLSFIGFFLFYLIWEVHPRYLLCVLPLFLSFLFIGNANTKTREDKQILD